MTTKQAGVSSIFLPADARYITEPMIISIVNYTISCVGFVPTAIKLCGPAR